MPAMASMSTRPRRLLDALTIRRRKGPIEGLIVWPSAAMSCTARVARSNIHLAEQAGRAGPRGCAVHAAAHPALRTSASRSFATCATGLSGADVVMMLRLQLERMTGAFVPSQREYYRFFGLNEEKLRYAKPDALVMHPGPDEPRH